MRICLFRKRHSPFPGGKRGRDGSCLLSFPTVYLVPLSPQAQAGNRTVKGGQDAVGIIEFAILDSYKKIVETRMGEWYNSILIVVVVIITVPL